MEKQIPEFIKNIDWIELANQKASLTAVRLYYLNNNVPFIPEHLDGILCLIDSLQEYAETPEQKFATENAQLIFEIAIEGEALYEDDEMPKEYIEEMIDDSFHMLIIKAKMRQAIFRDVTMYPKDFKRDENGKYTYDAEMSDYSGVITIYCRELFIRNL